MKRVASICVSLAFVMLAVAPAFAAEPAAPAPQTGTVTKVDAKAMMLTMKDDKGAEKTLYWKADTKVTAKDGKVAAADAIKEGGKISVKTMEKDGKVWATEISLQ